MRDGATDPSIAAVGHGATAHVYAARCIPNGELVAIKCVDLEKYGNSIDEIRVRRQHVARNPACGCLM